MYMKAVMWWLVSCFFGLSLGVTSEDWMLHTPGGGPLESLCPCLSSKLCPRIFGKTREDILLFGHLPICMDSREVRCCGASVDVENQEPIASASQDNYMLGKDIGGIKIEMLSETIDEKDYLTESGAVAFDADSKQRFMGTQDNDSTLNANPHQANNSNNHNNNTLEKSHSLEKTDLSFSMELDNTSKEFNLTHSSIKPNLSINNNYFSNNVSNSTKEILGSSKTQNSVSYSKDVKQNNTEKKSKRLEVALMSSLIISPLDSITSFISKTMDKQISEFGNRIRPLKHNSSISRDNTKTLTSANMTEQDYSNNTNMPSNNNSESNQTMYEINISGEEINSYNPKYISSNQFVIDAFNSQTKNFTHTKSKQHENKYFIGEEGNFTNPELRQMYNNTYLVSANVVCQQNRNIMNMKCNSTENNEAKENTFVIKVFPEKMPEATEQRRRELKKSANTHFEKVVLVFPVNSNNDDKVEAPTETTTDIVSNNMKYNVWGSNTTSLESDQDKGNKNMSTESNMNHKNERVVVKIGSTLAPEDVDNSRTVEIETKTELSSSQFSSNRFRPARPRHNMMRKKVYVSRTKVNDGGFTNNVMSNKTINNTWPRSTTNQENNNIFENYTVEKEVEDPQLTLSSENMERIVTPDSLMTINKLYSSKKNTTHFRGLNQSSLMARSSKTPHHAHNLKNFTPIRHPESYLRAKNITNKTLEMMEQFTISTLAPAISFTKGLPDTTQNSHIDMSNNTHALTENKRTREMKIAFVNIDSHNRTTSPSKGNYTSRASNPQEESLMLDIVVPIRRPPRVLPNAPAIRNNPTTRTRFAHVNANQSKFPRPKFRPVIRMLPQKDISSYLDSEGEPSQTTRSHLFGRRNLTSIKCSEIHNTCQNKTLQERLFSDRAPLQTQVIKNKSMEPGDRVSRPRQLIIHRGLRRPLNSTPNEYINVSSKDMETSASMKQVNTIYNPDYSLADYDSSELANKLIRIELEKQNIELLKLSPKMRLDTNGRVKDMGHADAKNRDTSDSFSSSTKFKDLFAPDFSTSSLAVVGPIPRGFLDPSTKSTTNLGLPTLQEHQAFTLDQSHFQNNMLVNPLFYLPYENTPIEFKMDGSSPLVENKPERTIICENKNNTNSCNDYKTMSKINPLHYLPYQNSPQDFHIEEQKRIFPEQLMTEAMFSIPNRGTLSSDDSNNNSLKLNYEKSSKQNFSPVIQTLFTSIPTQQTISKTTAPKSMHENIYFANLDPAQFELSRPEASYQFQTLMPLIEVRPMALASNGAVPNMHGNFRKQLEQYYQRLQQYKRFNQQHPKLFKKINQQ